MGFKFRPFYRDNSAVYKQLRVISERKISATLPIEQIHKHKTLSLQKLYIEKKAGMLENRNIMVCTHSFKDL